MLLRNLKSYICNSVAELRDNINVRDFLDDCERNGCVTHGEPFDIKYFEDKLIHTSIWKQLPDHAIQILEQAGYTKYDRNTDSIVFVEK